MIYLIYTFTQLLRYIMTDLSDHPVNYLSCEHTLNYL